MSLGNKYIVIIFFLLNIEFVSGQSPTKEDNFNKELIPLSFLVVNPDNLLSSLVGEEDLQKDAYNPKTHLGGYFRGGWLSFLEWFDDQPTYDWSILEKKLCWCAERHTRLTMRLSQFYGYPYDKDSLRIAPDNNLFRDVDNAYIAANNLKRGKDNVLLLLGKQIKIGFPQKLFWEMVREGCCPLITLQHEGDEFYEAFPNYNSDTFYKAWRDLLKNLAAWLNEDLRNTNGDLFLISGKPIKRKYLIEVMQAGFVGMYGEGWVKNYGVLPDKLRKVYRYARLYPKLFPDIPLSYPLAVNYDQSKYTLDGLEIIWSISNQYGLSGFYYDVIGQEGYHPYFNDSPAANLLRRLDFNNRRIGGEGSGLLNSEDLRDLLNHAYGAHFSGVALHNFAITGERNTPTAQKNWSKFKTLVGAQLYISNPLLTHKKGCRYYLSFQIQNLGMCRVFSPYWEPYVIYRDKQGNELKREKLKFDIKSIMPNSQDYKQAGIVRDVKPISQMIVIPKNTTMVNFAIIDPYGVYENYWLHNYGRTTHGEYVLSNVN